MFDVSDQFKDFKSFEIIFKDENEKFHKLSCDLQDIDSDKIVIHVDNKKNHFNYAKQGDEIQLNIYTEYGVFTSDSKILSAEQGAICTCYEISYPSHCRHSQRREYFRADLHVKFSLEVFFKNGDSALVEGITKNICGKGFCYMSDSEFFPHYAELNLNLLFNDRTITTSADLVYSKPTILGNQTKFANAFTFPDIEDKDVDYIVKQCFLYQLELRKKAL